MKNSTTAFLLFIFCMTMFYISNQPFMFISGSIFAATGLIINQIKKND